MTLTILASCGPKTSSVEYDDGTISGLNQDEVSFSMIKSQILQPHCINCHASEGTESGIKKWITPGDPDNSPFFTEVENGNMPRNASALTTKDLQLIRSYIEQMKNTAPAPTPIPTPTPTPTPTPSRISYTQVKSRILTPYGCTSCHSVGTEARLARWINTTTPSKSSFYTSVKSGSMPQGGSDVSAADQAFILQYVQEYSAAQ